MISTIISFLFDDFDSALAMTEKVKAMQKNMESTMYFVQILHLCEGMVSLSFTKHGADVKILIINMKQHNGSLKSLCVNGLENFSNKYHLLETKLARIENNQP